MSIHNIVSSKSGYFSIRESGDYTSLKSGLFLKMKDGTTWFHPYTGAKPTQLSDGSKVWEN